MKQILTILLSIIIFQNQAFCQLGFVPFPVLNAAHDTATNTNKFIETLAHEYAHNYTSKEGIANSAGSLAKFMWGIGNALNFTSINTSGKATLASWYSSNSNSSLLQENTKKARGISEENRNKSIGSDLVVIYTKAKGRINKETREYEIRPSNDYNLTPIGETISLSADINPLSISGSVSGIITRIMLEREVVESIKEQANINVSESYENMKNPQGKLAEMLFNNNLIESGYRDIDKGEILRGNAKLGFAGLQTIGMFIGGAVAVENASFVRTAGNTITTLMTPTENSLLSLGKEVWISKVDFFVTPQGQGIPSVAYRYISLNDTLLPSIRKSMVFPARGYPTYFSFDKYDVPAGKFLQSPPFNEGSIRLEFRTYQLLDDIRVPYGQQGTASYLEPIAVDYPEFGSGQATQGITNKAIRLNNITDLKNINK